MTEKLLQTFQNRKSMLTTRSTTANSGLAKGGVSCFVETFVQHSTFVLRMNIRAKNPALRQATNRWL
jgi:hypothetical protein